MNDLSFTGERFTPECLREMWYEHYHRYVFARAFAKDKQVADIACGEGYGSALLAQTASSVIGIDISSEAVAHARERYGELQNIKFNQADAIKLSLGNGSVDLVTSFETLEHLAEQSQLLDEFSRILKEDGVLLISTPDKRSYSDQRDYHNEFHIRELYRHEFLDLLKKQFPAVRLFGQKLLFQSVIWNQEESLASATAHTLETGTKHLVDRLDYAPLYFIAICARQVKYLPELPGFDLFGDAEESVYRHYEHEVRKNMKVGAILNARDAELADERLEHSKTRARLQALEQVHVEKSKGTATRPWWRKFF